MSAGTDLSLQEEFTLLAVIGWIFLLRIKLEAIPTGRKIPTENMLEFGQASSHSGLGMVGGCRVLKLCRREHMASGSILKCLCCCEGRNPGDEDLHAPQLLCPVCSIWPIVRDRVDVGELMFPFFQSRNLTRHLRERGARCSLLTPHWPAAHKLGTHSFRRGAARALMPGGGSDAQLLRAGQWRGHAVRLYFDIGEDERRALTDILVEDSEDKPS